MGNMMMFVTRRLWLIFVVYAVSIMIAAMLFCHFENKEFLDALWWACITALTVGYGDISPVTIEGRMTGIIFGHAWIFLIIPMIIANIVTKFIPDFDKFTNAEQEWQERALKLIAKRLKINLEEAPPDNGDV